MEVEWWGALGLISNVCHECREGCFGTTRKGNSMGSNSQHQASLYNMADALCSDLFYDNNLAHFTSGREITYHLSPCWS